jgi:predicted Rossmann fold flavoprotein
MTSDLQTDDMAPRERTEVCIVGAGPAGLMAAICAAREGVSTLLTEANTQPGRKLLITGGGRCNFTRAAETNDLIRAFGTKGRFLRHAFHEIRPDDIIQFFRQRGVESVVEPDGSVFPLSQHAVDIRAVFVREIDTLGVHLLAGNRVVRVGSDDGGFFLHTTRRDVFAKRLIVATGGASWPQTGSTGDGYRFAESLGHTIAPPKAALVPLVTAESWPGTLAGVSIAQVVIKTNIDGRKVTVHGALLFTHDGIGGPAGLDLSRHLADRLSQTQDGVDIRIDWIPDNDEGQLDRRLQEQLAAHSKKTILNVLADLVPKRLASVLCDLVACDADLQAGRLRKEMRRHLVTLLKGLPLHVTRTRPITEATVTRGGVICDQIDPHTMESRIHRGLFFAGEVIDVDGPCGGYNLHACWATGTLAGRAAART